MEQVIAHSGLPLEGSIAQCHGSRIRTEEWCASLERIGQERSRIEELPLLLTTRSKQSFFQKLYEALPLEVWNQETDLPQSQTVCIFLSNPCELSCVVQMWEGAHLLRLEPIVGRSPLENELDTHNSETWESMIPDTDQSRTLQQMSQAWKSIGRPMVEDDISLSVDPDDYPLF